MLLSSANSRESHRTAIVKYAQVQRLAEVLCWLLLSVVSLSAVGCSSTCDTGGSSQDTVRFTGGHTDLTLSRYESNGFDEPFLVFPPGRRYEFPHGFGQVPTQLGIFLAFQDEPLKNNSSFSLAAGNEALIEAVDANVIRIRNDTCADFYVRVDAGVAPRGSM